MKKEKICSVLAAMGEVIIDLDEQGLICSWPAQAENMFGYRSHEILEEHLTMLSSGHGKGDMLNILDQCTQEKDNRSFLVTGRKKDGSLCNLVLLIRPMISGKGKKRGSSVSIRECLNLLPDEPRKNPPSGGDLLCVPGNREFLNTVFDLPA